MNYKVLFAALLIAAISRAGDAELDPMPESWGNMAGGGPLALQAQCRKGIDRSLAQAGQDNFTIVCDQDVAAFGGMTETFPVGDFFGKRIRYSAWLQGKDISDVGNIEGGASLFITVPSVEGPLLNRLEARKLIGTTNWEYREFVVDIPEHEDLPSQIPRDVLPMATGFWIQGKGQVWIRDIKVEVVPDSTPINLSYEVDRAPGPIPITLD